MRVTFLGTGTSTGVPVIGCDCRVCTSTDVRDNRLRSSVFISVGKPHADILIDAGPDLRQQVLLSGIRHVDAILLTHQHYDHVGGLDDVRGFNFTMHSGVHVYARKQVIDVIHRNMPYVFERVPYPGAPQMTTTVIDDSPFSVNGVSILPLPVIHGRMPICGYRIGPLSYITDASFVPAETMERLRGTKTLIINALGQREHPSHLSLRQAIEIALAIEPQETYFTHISHAMGFHILASATLPRHMALAYDGLTVEV